MDELVKQLPAILMALAAVISAFAALRVNVKNAKEIAETKKVVKEELADTKRVVEVGNAVAESTHKMLNSQLDEYKKNLEQTALSAAREALEEGRKMGRAELAAEQALVAEGVRLHKETT